MRFNTLPGWLAWLESCHPKEIELGLDRVGRVAQRLCIEFEHTSVITVAGTNGKGSCVASLNALLLSAGCRVGCYTSPHFIDYNERIQINGQPVDDQSLLDSFARIDQARGDIALTYFEFGTLAALDIFRRSRLDVIVLEVGLGGRLDAVNIIDPDIAIVTSIAVDHQQWLGSNREQIGVEKAGIFRAGKIAICAESSPPESVLARAKELGTHCYIRGNEFDMVDSTDQQWNWRGLSAQSAPLLLAGLPCVNLPMDSVVAAIQAVQLLNVERVDYHCLASLQLRGRFQHIDAGGRQIILDVAHNPAAAGYLAARLQREPCSGCTFGLVAMMSDKDAAGIVAALKNTIDSWHVADLQSVPRAMNGADLAELISREGIAQPSVSQSVEQACQLIFSRMKREDRLLVFGSFFTVAEVLQLQLLSRYKGIK